MITIKKMKKIVLGFILGASFVSVSALAQQRAVLEFFHGAECPHCHEEKGWFPELQQMYPDLEIREYEIWHDEKNRLLAETRLAELGQKLDGVPTNIIEGEVVVGFNQQKIEQLLEKNYGPPAEVARVEKAGFWSKIKGFFQNIFGK